VTYMDVGNGSRVGPANVPYNAGISYFLVGQNNGYPDSSESYSR